MRKPAKLIAVVFALMVFLVGIHSTGQAAVVNNLLEVPTANIISNQGAIAGEMSGAKGRFEAVYKLDPKVEIGGEIVTYNGEMLEPGPLVRVLFSRETKKRPAIAAGLKGRDLYVTASKSLGYGVNGHIGIGDGDYDGLYVGLNKVINPVSVEVTGESSVEVTEESNENSSTVTSTLPTTNLMVEYIDQEINLGARVNLKNTLHLDLGLLGFDRFKLGLNYGF